MATKISGDDAGKRHRRPRYPGKNPRQFAHKYKELAPDRYPGMHEHVRSRGKTPAGAHVPVMLDEVLEAIEPRPGETVADCTVGHGGHAAALIARIAPSGMLVGLDVDGAEIERARTKLEGKGPDVRLFRRNFAGLDSAAAEADIASFDAILADLGVSSMQIDDPARGFSYKLDGPLDMRMDTRRGATAAELIAKIAEKDLSKALLELSDEPDHAAIAAAIAKSRSRVAISTTAELAGLVLAAKGITPGDVSRHTQKTHPAARTFQALRILVNDEIKNLKRFLSIAPALLSAGGRISVISFHSGEDRLIKKTFEAGRKEGLYSSVSPDAVRPSFSEQRANPRSAPAKLRWAVRA